MQNSGVEGFPPDILARCPAYRLYLAFVAAMLDSLAFDFVSDALDFVGVHEQRMQQVCAQPVTISLIFLHIRLMSVAKTLTIIKKLVINNM